MPGASDHRSSRSRLPDPQRQATPDQVLGRDSEHTWPDSLDVMGWRVEDDGLGVQFSRDISTIIRRDYAAALDAFLMAQGVGRATLGGLAVHTRATNIVQALE